MKWIEILRTPFIWVYNNIEPIETSQMADIGKSIDYTINPATDLPMIGAVDIQGNILVPKPFSFDRLASHKPCPVSL